MITSQHYKVVNKRTKEVTTFEGDSYSAVIAFLREQKAYPDYSNDYEIYSGHESVSIIDGAEQIEKGESRLCPIFLINKKTKEVIECYTLPRAMQFIEANGIVDYDVIYDQECDGGEALRAFGMKLLAYKKNELLEELALSYNTAKSVTIRNGHSFVISKQNPAYEYFVKIIENACNGISPEATTEFQMFEDNGDEVRIRLKNAFWAIVFKQYNAERAELALHFNRLVNKITRCESIDILTGIDISLPYDGFLVDINKIVLEIDELIKQQQKGKIAPILSEANVALFYKAIPDVKAPAVAQYIPFN